jgi:hypothetical protein
MGDAMASGTNPGTTHTISPSSDPGVYHEDRVVVTEVGSTYVTQMFRVYGATLDVLSGTWSYMGATTAYATVQNPDGSIHYFTYSGTNFWLTSAWEGSDNNTVYNAVDFGVTASGSDTSNSAALTALFTAMATATFPALLGGTATIPQYNFPVAALSLGPPINSIFQSLGTGGQKGIYTAFHFSISDPEEASSPSIFLLCDNSDHTPGGIIFRNVAFQWVEPAYAGDTCLYFNVWNNVAQECTFTDCPRAINFQGLQQSAKQCSINYGVNITTPTAISAIILGGNQCEVSGPSEMNGGLTSGTAPVPIGNAFMYICGGPSNCDHSTLRNLHIYQWNYGVDYSDVNSTGISGGCQNTVIDGCHMEIFKTCVNMKAVSSDTVVFNQTIVNCTLEKGQDSMDGSPIVFIDSNGGLATNIGPITLSNNLIFSNVTYDPDDPTHPHYGEAQDGQYGVQIGTCADVSIVGGRISQMGGNNPTEPTTGSANICISGDPTSVTLPPLI